MIRFLLFLVPVAISCVSGADHEVFKNCSRIPFCTELRNKIPDDLLTAKLEGFTTNDDIITIPLTNSAKLELNLYVSLLNNRTARVKILEKESKRYELVDVLQKEPTKLSLTADTTVVGKLTIKSKDKKHTHKVVVTADPLKIEFYYNDDVIQSTFKGDRLIFKKDSQNFAFGVDFNEAKTLVGLHHHAFDLELPDNKESKIDPFRLRNSDTANYEVGSPMALYGSVPAVYGHSEKSTSGIFLHNAAEQWIDVSYSNSVPSVYFMVEGAALDLFVFLGNTPKDVVRQFVELTGVAHMPQLWTLGYHQCRWSYMSQDEAKDVVANMNSHDFPLDALWLDIDYTDGFRYFTWNPETFSDPIGFQKNISASNKKLVTILDPHIKKDEDYPVYAGAKGKFFVKYPNGSDFEGDCWPGLSSYIDFLDPEARNYYASWYSYDKFNLSTPTLAGVWNDMNEPSVFDDSLEKTMPFDVLHHGNVRHGDIHNIYGFLQTKATHQGLMQRDNNTKRPFILTRSTFAGSQRYAAMWTGDNTADWPYLKVSYSECILSNLVGLVFCGADTGGFFGNPDVELAQRWYQAGAWLTFYRGHATNDTKRREPYVYEDDVQANIRNSLETRYKHIPVWYTLFYEHTRTGDPIVRPLFYEYPGLINKDDHLLLGSDILVRPVMEQNAKTVSITFPGKPTTYWYRVDNSNEIYAGGDEKTIPVNITTSPYFYKGGSLIARKDLVRGSTTDTLQDPYSIYINLDRKSNAVGKLYVDDFTSFDYAEKNLYCYLQLTYIPETGTLSIEPIDGICPNFSVKLSHLIINQKKSSGDGYTSKIITNLADGTSLKDINIIPKLANKKINLKL